jgi:hypothetical protein
LLAKQKPPHRSTTVSIVFAERNGLFLKSNAACVLVDLADENQDTINDTPNSADSTKAANAYEKLNQALLVVAKVEAVNAEPTKEESKQRSNQLRLGFVGSSSRSGSSQRRTAVSADCLSGNGLCSAVSTVVRAGACGKATGGASSGAFGQLFAAILTKHGMLPPKNKFQKE